MRKVFEQLGAAKGLASAQKADEQSRRFSLLDYPRANARGACAARFFGYTVPNNTRQGYARKSTLKLAGYLLLGV